MAIKQAAPYGEPGTLVEPRRRPFSVDEYYRMADSGILTDDDRVELIEGEIVQMTPIGSRHAACVKKLIKVFTNMIGGEEILSVQDPIRLDEFTEPEPDIAVLKERDDFYAKSHPGPEDVLLIIEVADASVRYDREVKIPLYAKAGIPEVWIVNLPDKTIEMFRNPVESGYEETSILRKGQSLSPTAFSEVEIRVEEILV